MTIKLYCNVAKIISLLIFILLFYNLDVVLSEDAFPEQIRDEASSLSLTDQPVFLSKPQQSIVEAGTSYAYSVCVYSPDEKLTDISLITDHKWLSLNNIDLSKGMALLNGTPQINHIGCHMIKIQIKTNSHIISESCMITVPVLYDSFEYDNSGWTIVENDQYINEWIFGHLISKTGSKAAYTTQPNFDYNESTLKKSIDLQHIVEGKLTFFCNCGACETFDGYSLANYGQLIITDKKGSIYKYDLHNFMGVNWWKESFDLSRYSGEMIDIQVKWLKNIYYKSDGYGISIDDFLITGKYSQKPIFIDEPPKKIMVGQTYSYPVQPYSLNDVSIKMIRHPEWLKLDGELSSNNLVLTGSPEYSDMKIHSVIIEAENTAGSTVLSYSLEVMFFFDDFEQDLSSRLTTGEKPYTFNFWVIGDIDSHEHDKLAYITFDKEGKHSNFRGDKISRALLTYSMDFSHLISPQLSFSWKCLSAYYSKTSYSGYGEVYIADMDGKIIRVSELAALEGSDKWTQKTIDLNEYQGKTISLIFKWTNDAYSAGHISGLMIDDIEIRGNYTSSPVTDAPIFVSSPDTIGYTVYAGDLYAYSIITKDFNNDWVDIDCEICPDWLTIVNKQPDKGTALLTGEP